MTVSRVLIRIFWLFLLALPLLRGSAPVLMIRDVAIFDSEARTMLPRQSVLIRGERIEALGRDLKAPREAQVLDGRGRYLIPGLIDAHTHVVTVLYWAQMTGEVTFPYYLANGVTSIRNTGDRVAAQKLLQRYALEHPAISPRLFLASDLIDGDPPIHPDIGWPLTNPEKVPAFVQDMARWGVQTLKIYARCSPEVARRVIEEGHKHGLVVTGHLSKYRVDQAIADGIDCLEHIESVSDFLRADPRDRHSLDLTSDAARRTIAQLAERKIFVDPTLMVFWGTLFFADRPDVISHPDNAHMPKRLLDFWAKDRETRLQNYSSGPIAVRERTFRKYQELVGMLHRAGVPLLAGTDAPEPQVPPGYALHHELELLVESGLSPADALAAATINNSRVLKQDMNLGSIRAGKLADLVVLNADPLTDIRNSRKIHRVIRGGVVLDPAVILSHARKE